MAQLMSYHNIPKSVTLSSLHTEITSNAGPINAQMRFVSSDNQQLKLLKNRPYDHKCITVILLYVCVQVNRIDTENDRIKR